MEFGVSIFFTDYSITPAELAVALEERGFDSLWAAEHSHIPVPRRTPAPGGGELPKRYYDVMDPFVTLTAAAAVTKRLKLATGICLVIHRDTIQTAKLVASIDQVSGGRFLFGIGGGWNREEIESHGTAFGTRMQKMREQIEAMKEIWTKSTAEYDGEIVKVTRMMTWPKPVQKPWPPVILGGAFPWAARGALWRRLVPERVERRSRRIHAAFPANGDRRRPRSGGVAGDDGRRPGRRRPAQAVARFGRGARQFQPAAGRSRPALPDPRPLGQASAAGQLIARHSRTTSCRVDPGAPLP